MDKPVDVLCYGTIDHFDTRAEAIAFFKEGMWSCEGAERERYSLIVSELVATRKPLVSDGSTLRQPRGSVA